MMMVVRQTITSATDGIITLRSYVAFTRHISLSPTTYRHTNRRVYKHYIETTFGTIVSDYTDLDSIE